MRNFKPFLPPIALLVLLSACGKNNSQVKDDPLSCDKMDVKIKAANDSRAQTELATYQLLKSNVDANKKVDAVKSLLDIEKAFIALSGSSCNKADASQRTNIKNDDISGLLQTAVNDLKAGRAVSNELLLRLNPEAEGKAQTEAKAETDKIAAAWNNLSARVESEIGIMLEIDADAQGKKSVQPKDREALDASIKQAQAAKDYPSIKASAGDKTLQLPSVLKSLGEVISALTDSMIQSLAKVGRDPADGILIRAYLIDLNKSLTELDQKLRKHDAVAASSVTSGTN
ncbi:MAG: hypothetical protein JST80_03765 [Bdellovibrionales bacterium]|nr:hypothetical protein [Bdellovibrionales bacterium]